MDPHGAAALHSVIDRLQARVRGAIARKDNSAAMAHSLGMLWGREQMAEHLENVNTASVMPARAFWCDLAKGRLRARDWKSNMYSVLMIKHRSMVLIRSTVCSHGRRTFYIYPTCERVANCPRLFVGRWKRLPEVCEGVIASFLDLGDLRSACLTNKKFSLSFKPTSPFVDLSSLARRRLGYTLDRSNVVQALLCYNAMRGSASHAGKPFTLLDVARTDTAREGRILGLYPDPTGQGQTKRFVVVTSRGYIGWCMPNSRVFTMDPIAARTDLHVRGVTISKSGALLVSTNMGVAVSSLTTTGVAWTLVGGSSVLAVSSVESELYIWRGSGRHVDYVDMKTRTFSRVMLVDDSGERVLTSCTHLRACAKGAVCCIGKKTLAFMCNNVAIQVRLLGAGKIVYISEQMPNGEIYVFRAVHAFLRSIDVFKGSVRVRSIALEGAFCQSYPFTTCGDTVVYYDGSLKAKCVRVRGRFAQVSTSVINDCPMHTQCRPYMLGAKLFLVSNQNRVSMLRLTSETLYNEATRRGTKRKLSAI